MSHTIWTQLPDAAPIPGTPQIASLYVTNVAALRALAAAPTENLHYSTLGHATAGDGNHGCYRWDSASTAADDDAETIKITAVTTGRFKLFRPGEAVYVTNVAALRALTAAPIERVHYSTLGYATAGDGGHAPYRWDSASTAADDGGATIKITAVATGRFKLINDGVINVLQFGTNALQAASDSLTYGTVYIPANTTIVLGAAGFTGKSNVQILGEDKFTSIIQLSVNPTAEFMAWSSKTNFSVKNLTIDWNNKVAPANNSAISCTLCSRFDVENIRVINIDKFGIGLNGCTYYSVRKNYIHKVTAVNTQNQAILISDASGVSTDGTIELNECQNTGINASCSRTSFIKNTVYNFKFGGGITTEQAANCHSLTIDGNTVYGGTGTDVNATACPGIENWAPRSTISKNICYSNAGSGIDQGGQFCTTDGNICFNNGTVGGSGIEGRYGTATYNGSYSTYTGNICFDTAGAGGTQSYGFADHASVSYCKVFANNFKQNKLGAQNVLSTLCTLDIGSIDASVTYDPPSLAAGAIAATDITVAGATLGDYVLVSFSLDLQLITLNAYVSATNAVKVTLHNITGGTIDLASGTLKVRVIKPRGAADY